MTVLEKLVIERVRILQRIKELRDASSILSCKYQYEEVEDLHFGGRKLIEKRKQTCIEIAYHQVRELNANSWCVEYSYDEVFESLDEEACDHCKMIRANKRERVKLRTRFGQINSCITKIGQRLIKND